LLALGSTDEVLRVERIAASVRSRVVDDQRTRELVPVRRPPGGIRPSSKSQQIAPAAAQPAPEPALSVADPVSAPPSVRAPPMPPSTVDAPPVPAVLASITPPAPVPELVPPLPAVLPPAAATPDGLPDPPAPVIA